eukprot:CAMPEP_0204283984 /NCGR_PEP_ID=MMETSP0468-20130131/47455_1 /ASSEMBLY_ACC=CAM_ASM_000383 /TAXON_ID=2969 /ORGANISM="Oxyrrhis marina" /LENGTH=90 /DNA_ID=CAMNT_0051261673 /DNA_START=117 /DNA_END=389 /DNA_ORIENTATION=+
MEYSCGLDDSSSVYHAFFVAKMITLCTSFRRLINEKAEWTNVIVESWYAESAGPMEPTGSTTSRRIGAPPSAPACTDIRARNHAALVRAW